MMKIDIGNLHVIDYYLRKATYKQLMDRIETVWPRTYERYDFDIGNQHMIAWYLWNVLQFRDNATFYGTAFMINGRTIPNKDIVIDFDIETEQREGWAYDDYI